MISVSVISRRRYQSVRRSFSNTTIYVHNITKFECKNFTEDVDVKGMLSTIQNQQVVARQTHEIAKHTSKHAPQSEPPPQQHIRESEEIRVLSERIDQLLVEIRQKDALMEERLDKLTQLLMDKR